MKMRTIRRFVPVVMISTLGLLGCEAPDWENPEYVGKMLASEDLTSQRTALDRARELPADKQALIVPQLVDLYNRGGGSQKDAMGILAQLRDPKATEAFIAELETDAAGYARASAETLGEIGATDAIPKMLEVLGKTDQNEVKLGIIQGFGHMPTKEMVPALLDILKLDVDSNPISLHAHTCEVLGNLAQKDPSAITQPVIEQVTLAVFFGTTGRSLDLDCGLAIQQIGEPAVPELLKIFRGEREDVQTLMMRYDTPDDAFPQNVPRFIAAKRLSSMRAAAATETFTSWLAAEHAAPDTVKDMKAVEWRMKEGETMSEVIHALGGLGGDAAVKLLEETVKGQRINKEWDDVTDGLVELQLRQDAGFALNATGNRASTAVLLEQADKGVINDLERRFARLGNADEVQRYQFNWMTLRTAAMLSDGSDLDKFQALVSKNEAQYAALSKKMAESIPVVQVAVECNAKASDGEKGACYAAKLKDNSPDIREKAAWELSRLPAETARPLLLENLPNDMLDTREVIVGTLYKFPDASAVGAIDAVLKAEATKGGAYRIDHYRLKLLRAWLVNNTR